MLHAVKNQEQPETRETVVMKEPGSYKKAVQKLAGIKVGAAILACIVYGALCAKFGLALASLLTAGISVILIPLAIYYERNKAKLEEKFMRKTLKVPEPEELENRDFTADFKYWATRSGLQFYIKSGYPRFHGQKHIRVLYEDVPNGIPYEIKNYYFDEEHGAESLDLEIPSDDLMAKAWDKKLRQKIINHDKPDIAIAFNPKIS